MKLKKIGEVWSSANRLLSDFIGSLSSKNFATKATWRNDFSSLYFKNVLYGRLRPGVQQGTFSVKKRFIKGSEWLDVGEAPLREELRWVLPPGFVDDNSY